MRDRSVVSRVSARTWLVFYLIVLFYAYAYVLRVMPSVMTLQLLDAYQLSPSSFANLEGAFYFVYVPLQFIVGVLLDRYASRWLLPLGLMSCAIGSYLFGGGVSSPLAFSGRLFMGFGAAFAFVAALKFASVHLATRHFAFITGLVISLGTLGGWFGDIFLTRNVEEYGWQHTAYLTAFFGVILALFIFFLSSAKKQRTETVVPHFHEGFRHLARLLSRRGIWVNCLVGCLLYIPMTGFAETWGIPYLMAVYHLPKSIAAGAISMIFLGWVCGAPFVGFISDAIKTRRLPLTISATITAVLLSIILYVPNLGVGVLFVLLFFFGLFLSGQVIVFSISRELSVPQLTGTVIGITNMIIMLSGGSIFLIGLFLNIVQQHYLTEAIVYSWHFQLALAVLPLSLLAAVFLTFYLPETYCKPILSGVKPTYPS